MNNRINTLHKFTARIASTVLVLAMFLPSTSLAKQLSFVRESVNFDIQWRDAKRDRQALQFKLEDYPKVLSKFSAYKTDNLNNYLLRGLLKSPHNINDGQQQVDITIKNQRLFYSIQAPSQEQVTSIAKSLRELEEQLFEEYLSINYWKVESSVSGSAIILPDYQRLIIDSTPFMESIGNAIVDKFPSSDQGIVTRDVAEFVLNFVQNIPYEQLSPVQRGAGYLSPIQTLRNNLGDCDSKSALMASIMRYIFPRLGIRLLYTQDHALLAFALAAVGDDETVDINGLSLVVAEPTGPGVIELGKMAASTRAQINSGAYVSITIP